MWEQLQLAYFKVFFFPTLNFLLVTHCFSLRQLQGPSPTLVMLSLPVKSGTPKMKSTTKGQVEIHYQLYYEKAGLESRAAQKSLVKPQNHEK